MINQQQICESSAGRNFENESRRKRQQLMSMIRSKQRSKILREDRVRRYLEEQQQMYYEKMDKVFFEEHLREVEEERLRIEYQKQQQQWYEQMYRIYAGENEMECENNLNEQLSQKLGQNRTDLCEVNQVQKFQHPQCTNT